MPVSRQPPAQHAAHLRRSLLRMLEEPRIVVQMRNPTSGDEAHAPQGQGRRVSARDNGFDMPISSDNALAVRV